MTTRELYNAAIAHINGDSLPYGLTTDELKTEFEALIAKMDSQNATRRAKNLEKAAIKQSEKAPIRDAILAVMGDENEPKTATTLIEEAGLTETVKSASIPSLLRPLIDSGIVGKVNIKITGKGTHRGYVRI